MLCIVKWIECAIAFSVGCGGSTSDPSVTFARPWFFNTCIVGFYRSHWWRHYDEALGRRKTPPPFLPTINPFLRCDVSSIRKADCKVKGTHTAELCGCRNSSLVSGSTTGPAHTARTTTTMPTCGPPPCSLPVPLQVRTHSTAS